MLAKSLFLYFDSLAVSGRFQRCNTMDEAFSGFETAGWWDMARQRVSLIIDLALSFLHAGYRPSDIWRGNTCKCVEVLSWGWSQAACVSRRQPIIIGLITMRNSYI